MISNDDLLALWVTFKLASVSTVLLLAIGAPVAWWLARTHSRARAYVETIIALPLVLPPTVLGFYLLLILSPQSWFGGLIKNLTGQSMAFTFSGLVIGSVVYSAPFVIQPLRVTFANISHKPLEVAATLGADRWDRFFSVTLPTILPGVVSAAVLAFAHTLGEFGVVLMIGGNIAGETHVASIAIYEHVESLSYAKAHWLSAIMVLTSFTMLLAIYRSNSRFMPFSQPTNQSKA